VSGLFVPFSLDGHRSSPLVHAFGSGTEHNYLDEAGEDHAPLATLGATTQGARPHEGLDAGFAPGTDSSCANRGDAGRPWRSGPLAPEALWSAFWSGSAA